LPQKELARNERLTSERNRLNGSYPARRRSAVAPESACDDGGLIGERQNKKSRLDEAALECVA